MRAMIADHPGPPAVLHRVELPDPRPGPGQVGVTVTVAAITFIDVQLRAGTSPGPAVSFPAVLGNGVGGTVTDTGDGVDAGWIGTEVVTSTGVSAGMRPVPWPASRTSIGYRPGSTFPRRPRCSLFT